MIESRTEKLTFRFDGCARADNTTSVIANRAKILMLTSCNVVVGKICSEGCIWAEEEFRSRTYAEIVLYMTEGCIRLW